MDYENMEIGGRKTGRRFGKGGRKGFKQNKQNTEMEMEMKEKDPQQEILLNQAKGVSLEVIEARKASVAKAIAELDQADENYSTAKKILETSLAMLDYDLEVDSLKAMEELVQKAVDAAVKNNDAASHGCVGYVVARLVLYRALVLGESIDIGATTETMVKEMLANIEYRRKEVSPEPAAKPEPEPQPEPEPEPKAAAASEAPEDSIGIGEALKKAASSGKEVKVTAVTPGIMYDIKETYASLSYDAARVWEKLKFW